VCFSSFVECLQLKTVCQRPLATKRCFYRTLLIDCSFFYVVKKTLLFKKPNRKTSSFTYIKGNFQGYACKVSDSKSALRST